MLAKIGRFWYFRVMVWVRARLWRALLSSAGGTLGDDAFLYEGVRVVQGHPGSIRLGNRLRLLRNVTLNTLPPNGELRVGDDVHVGEGSMISSHARIDIEDHVVIGPYNVVVDVDHICEDRSRPISKQGLASQPIRIREGAWICSHCIILKGTTIGRGAVVGAGSVVTHDVPDFAVVAGVPARVLRTWGEAED